MAKNLIKELEQGDVFSYNGREYKLTNHQQYNRNSKVEALDDKSEHIFGELIEVHLIGKVAKVSEFSEHKKEYLSPFDTVKNDLFSEHKKINDIAANSPDKKLKLYLGCFNKPIPHWVNVDVRPYPETLCDVVDDILKLEKFEDNSVDEILSVHTLEHVGRYEYKDALKVWHSKLKPNSKLYISVPDMNAVFEHYIYHRDLEFLYSFIWGSQKHKADWHGCGFNFELLKKSLEEIGFRDVKLYDWTKTEWHYIDSYAGAYAKHMDRSSRLMSLNIEAIK